MWRGVRGGRETRPGGPVDEVLGAISKRCHAGQGTLVPRLRVRAHGLAPDQARLVPVTQELQGYDPFEDDSIRLGECVRDREAFHIRNDQATPVGRE